MTWLPDALFIGQAGAPEQRPNRPYGQGDVFRNVPVATTARADGGPPQLKAKTESLVIVVASSCGMRKGPSGSLADRVHVAPIKRLASIAPSWGPPWEGRLNVLPVLGLTTDEVHAANLAMTGLTSMAELRREDRVASMTEDGLLAMKTRISSYFTRTAVPSTAAAVGAMTEWNELDLWERWTARTGSEDGFQEWLDDPNLNYPDMTRRRTIYDDLVGIEQQLDEATGA